MCLKGQKPPPQSDNWAEKSFPQKAAMPIPHDMTDRLLIMIIKEPKRQISKGRKFEIGSENIIISGYVYAKNTNQTPGHKGIQGIEYAGKHRFSTQQVPVGYGARRVSLGGRL